MIWPRRALGTVEGGFGALQQFLAILSGEGIDGKAEGGGEADVAVTKVIRRRQHLADHLAEFLGTRPLEDQRQHEGEFVAIVASDQRAVRNAGPETMGDLTEDFIAGCRAEQIVDRLETVEVDDADGEGGRIAGTLSGDLQDLVPHAIAVAQSGQRIGIGHRLKLILTDGQESYVRRFHHPNPSFPPEPCRRMTGRS